MSIRYSPEAILSVLAEGGSISIERRLDRQGRWHYGASIDESTLWDMLDEVDDRAARVQGPPDARALDVVPSSLDDAFRSIGRFPWPRLHLHELHPDFEPHVLQAARFHRDADEHALTRLAAAIPLAVERHRGRRVYAPHEAAARIAAIVHREQVRKGTKLPYVSHVVTVSHLLAQSGAPADVVLAGLLHDVLEDYEDDTSTRDALQESFPTFDQLASAMSMADALRKLIDEQVGAEVCWLVEAVTEQKVDVDAPDAGTRPWKIRKVEQLRHLVEADPRVAALKGTDALHNVHSIVADSRATDGAVFDRFNASPDDLIWYYATVLGLCARQLETSHPLRERFDAASRGLEQEVERALGPRDLFTGHRERRTHRATTTTLAVQSRRGRIVDVEAWRVLAPPARSGHWQAGRSAMESARSWFAQAVVEPTMPAAIRALLDAHPDTAGAVFHTVRPEHETSLDDLGKGRQHDLVAYGLAGDRRLVVAVEAKADEPFGELIGNVLERADAANADRDPGDRPVTRRRERIERLSRRIFGRDPDDSIAGLRYQLLHALAGAVFEAQNTGASMACLLVQEFVGKTSPTAVERNDEDFRRFVRAFGIDVDAATPTGTLHGPIRLALSDELVIDVYLGKATTVVTPQKDRP